MALDDRISVADLFRVHRLYGAYLPAVFAVGVF